MTLYRFCRAGASSAAPPVIRQQHNRQIFSRVQESELVEYLEAAAKLYHGLAPKEVRKLAYQYATRNNIKCPATWNDVQQAGVDWFNGFMKRNRELSIRKPEATSLSRATSFNRTNISMFFDNLAAVLDQYKFQPQNIYEMCYNIFVL